ncbi:MAG TPA: HNH endonuclease signature motif containing protein [Jatrophihabitans sp.]
MVFAALDGAVTSGSGWAWKGAATEGVPVWAGLRCRRLLRSNRQISADSRFRRLFRFPGSETSERMDTVSADSLELLTDAQVVEGMRAELRVQHEAEVRLIGLVDQVARRGLAQVHGCKSAVRFLRQLLNVLAYSDKQRLFSEQQRLAMLARDGGCSYPGCDAALGWLETHHVTDHQHTGRTSVDDGTLVCGTHHDTFARMGWTSRMLNGRPHWVPPDWLDPDREPQRSRMHDRE